MFFNSKFFHLFCLLFFIKSINSAQFFSDQELKSFLYSLIRKEWPSEEAWKNFIDKESSEGSMGFDFLGKILLSGDKSRLSEFFSTFFSSGSGINAISDENEKVNFVKEVIEGFGRGDEDLQSGNLDKFIVRMQKKYKTQGIRRSDIDALRSFCEKLFILCKEIRFKPYPREYSFESRSIIIGGDVESFDRKNINMYEISPFLDQDALLKGLKEEIAKKKKIEFKSSASKDTKDNIYITIENNEKLRKKFEEIRKMVVNFKIEESVWQQISFHDPIGYELLYQDQIDKCRLPDDSMISIKDLRSKFIFFDFNEEEQRGEGNVKNGIVVMTDDLSSVGNKLKNITESNLIPYNAKIFVLLSNRKNTFQKKLYLSDNGYSTKLNNQGYRVLQIQKYHIEPEKYEKFADMKALLEKEPQAFDIHVIDKTNDINRVLTEVGDYVVQMLAKESLKGLNSAFANDIKKIATNRFLNGIKRLEGTVILDVGEIRKKMQLIYESIDKAVTQQEGDFLSQCSLECNKKIVMEIMKSPCPFAEKIVICNAFDAVEKKKIIDSGYHITDVKPLFKDLAPDLNALMKFFGSFAKSNYALKFGQELMTDSEENDHIDVNTYIQKCIDYFKNMTSEEVEAFCRQHKFLFVPSCRPEDIAYIYNMQGKKEENDEELLKRRNFLDIDYLMVAHGLSISYDDAKKMILKVLRTHYEGQGAFKENSNVILYILCNEKNEIRDKLESYNPRKEKEMHFISLVNSPGRGQGSHNETNVKFDDTLQALLDSDSGYTPTEFKTIIMSMFRAWKNGISPRDFFAKKEKNMFVLDGPGGMGKTNCPKLLTKWAYLLMAADHPDGEEYSMENVFMLNSGVLRDAYVASGCTKVSNYCAGKRKVCKENKNAWILFFKDEAFSENLNDTGQNNKKAKREDMETFKNESQTKIGEEHQDGIQFFATNADVGESWDSAFLSRLSKITIQQCTQEGYETHMKKLKIPIGDFSLKEKTLLSFIAPNYRIIEDNFGYFGGLWSVGGILKNILNENGALSYEQKLNHKEKVSQIQLFFMSKMMFSAEIIKNITDFTKLVANKDLIEHDPNYNKSLGLGSILPVVGEAVNRSNFQKCMRWLNNKSEQYQDLGSWAAYAKTLIPSIVGGVLGYFATQQIRSKYCDLENKQAWYNKTMGIASTFGFGCLGGCWLGIKFGDGVWGSVEERLFNRIAQNYNNKEIEHKNNPSLCEIKKAMKEAALQEKYLFKANIEKFIHRHPDGNFQWSPHLIKEKLGLFESFANFDFDYMRYTQFRSIKKFKEAELQLTPSFDHMFELIEYINQKSNKNNHIDARKITKDVSNYYDNQRTLIKEMNGEDNVNFFSKLGHVMWIFYDLLKSDKDDKFNIKDLKECYNRWSKHPKLKEIASSIIDVVSHACISFEIEPLCTKKEREIDNEKSQYKSKIVINMELMEEYSAAIPNLIKKLLTCNIIPQGASLEEIEMKEFKYKHDIIINYKNDCLYRHFKKKIDRLINPTNNSIVDVLNQRCHSNMDYSLYIDNVLNQVQSDESKGDEGLKNDIFYLKLLEEKELLKIKVKQKDESLKKESKIGDFSSPPSALYRLLKSQNLPFKSDVLPFIESQENKKMNNNDDINNNEDELYDC